MPARTFRIAVIPGDGIGQEVVPEGLRVLDRLAKSAGGRFAFAYETFPWGCEYYLKTGRMMDEDGTILLPVREMPVKSVITAPAPDSAVTAGYAWSGHGGITKVEVSTDGGTNWSEATIAQEAGRLSWVRFELTWDAAPGEARLRSRATDERGLQQPEIAGWNAKGDQMNAIVEVPVTVG